MRVVTSCCSQQTVSVYKSVINIKVRADVLDWEISLNDFYNLHRCFCTKRDFIYLIILHFNGIQADAIVNSYTSK